MIGLLILAPATMGEGLIQAVTHILGRRPPQLEVLAVDDEHQTPQAVQDQARGCIDRLDRGEGVLILADIFGASHTNAVCGVIKGKHVELVSGINLPMLLRVLNYRDLELAALVHKATSGGSEGIVCASTKQNTNGNRHP